ncbi:MAG: isoprenylcysteine carboxylmethyltransferase family protein [Planctomycetes bacterium]|nr:isoprenylcysteine carboxylmethyltransferase family protein [Planctomycetota bacterium]
MNAFAEVYFRHRSTVLLVLVAPLVVASLAGTPLDPLWAGVGIAIALAGAGLRLASMRCIGRGARVHRADVRGSLVTWGPYGVSRNPLYVAAALILTGLALASGWGEWGLLMFPAALLVYTPVVLHEEIAIAAAVGDEFSTYRAAVSRWLGPPGGALGPEERVPWSEVFKREKWLVPGVILGATAICLIRTDWVPLRRLLTLFGEALRLDPLDLALGALTLGALGNSWVVQLKRKRRVQRDLNKAGVKATLVLETLPEPEPDLPGNRPASA